MTKPADSTVQHYNPDRAPDADRERAVPDRKAEKELGGPRGPEPTRYGDWEKKGRCVDF